MESKTFVEWISPVLRQYWLPLILGGLGLIFFVYGMIQYFWPLNNTQDILSEAASTSALPSQDNKAVKVLNNKMITVDVEGAVVKPGVYKLSAQARAQDVAALDRQYLARNLGQARAQNSRPNYSAPRPAPARPAAVGGMRGGGRRR